MTGNNIVFQTDQMSLLKSMRALLTHTRTAQDMKVL